jgi:hypothetical protein
MQRQPYWAADRLVCQLGHLSRLMVKEPVTPEWGSLDTSSTTSHIAAPSHAGPFVLSVAISRPIPYDGLVSRERVAPSLRTRPFLAVAAFVLLFATAACGSRNSGRNPFDGSPASGNSMEDPIRIEVQNLNFNDVTMWAQRQGQRIRLGNVTGKTDHTFEIDWNVAMPISFVIDLVGGSSCTTQEIGVDPRARVWVSIPSVFGSQPCQVGRR